ncbi:Excalibur calcium-binding domain-containing protein [Austwickia chelonae]|uniref:Excalibur calcium-binding domain-containing protein n=1 Tax=Austwickia chelonae NBRC 105200 TaxID=1184607 RepID=K6UNP9_9MICO|nr:excalibur calcium-binding domain-containing protein [Austwickia chelonae]GAB79156.1 hypothetical protein AUCHE_20_00270 [Austwickia chelonae NBRC 105200]SEW42767.1 Excalibur calcium-binding domain-containing protein [Austwickia chelonae]
MTARFNPPPGWPSPPSDDWRPERGWFPPEDWPEAPPGWGFWVDEEGHRARGPYGLYEGETARDRGKRAAIGAVVVLGLMGACTGFNSTNRVSAPSNTLTPTVTTTFTHTATATTTATTTATATQTVTETATTTVTQTVPAAAPAVPAPPQPGSGAGGTTASVYYKNCDEARRAGAAPLHRGDPGYRPGLDRDGDGTACERRR